MIYIKNFIRYKTEYFRSGKQGKCNDTCLLGTVPKHNRSCLRPSVKPASRSADIAKNTFKFFYSPITLFKKNLKNGIPTLLSKFQIFQNRQPYYL